MTRRTKDPFGFRAMEKELAAKDKAARRYGVFLWRADGRYPRDLAVAEYKSPKLAQNKADRLNGLEPWHGNGGYVVRSYLIKIDEGLQVCSRNLLGK